MSESWAVHKWHAFYDHNDMVVICVLHNWIATSRVNGKGTSKISSHVTSHLMTYNELLNKCSRSEVVSPLWSCDILLNNHITTELSVPVVFVKTAIIYKKILGDI